MADTLSIRKKTADGKVWEHEDSRHGKFVISKMYCKTDGVTFKIVEQGGSQRREYHFADITVYDDTNGGVPVTYASAILLMQGLAALNYVGFYQPGQISIADYISSLPGNAIAIIDGQLFVTAGGVVVGDLISADANNIIVEGTDGKLYAFASGSDFDLPAALNAAPEKEDPVTGDHLPLLDSENGNVLKRVALSAIRTLFKAFYDTVYAPIGSYLKLTGTDAGSPVTGSIEMSELQYNFFHTNFDGDFLHSISFGEGGISIQSTSGEMAASLFFAPSGIMLSGVDSYNNVGTQRGLIGQYDFTPNITDLDYTQKKYVDEAIAAAAGGGGGVTTVTGTDGVTVADDGTDGRVVGLGDITPNSVSVLTPDGNIMLGSGGIEITEYGNQVAAISESGSITGVNITATNKTDIEALQSNKVDKDGTKVLSDVNFSTAKDTKLAGIATGATANRTDSASDVIINAKVQNNLTASTTVAPSATAVNNELANLERYFFRSTTPTAATSGTTLQILRSVQITGGTFDIGSQFEWNDIIERTGTSGIAATGFYIHTLNQTLGATLLGAYNIPATMLLTPFTRKISINASGIKIVYASAAPTNDAGATTTVTYAFNPANTYYLIFAVQPAGTDTFVASTFNIKGIK